MSDINAVNYQPLEEAQHTFRMTLKRFRVHSAVLVVAVIGLSILIPTLGIGLLIFGLALLMIISNAVKNGLWEQFAAVNGWPVNAVQDPLTVIPLSLEFGHSPRVSPAITATLDGILTDMLVYTTLTGDGKYQTEHNFTLARVELPAALPHILLRVKKDRAMLQQDFANHEALQLEGDFDDYFSLQVENGQEVNVLEILTPDVMQTLVSYGQHEDVEIEGSNLYFIIAGDNRGAESVRQLAQSVVTLSVQIIEHINQTAPMAVQPTAAPVAPVV